MAAIRKPAPTALLRLKTQLWTVLAAALLSFAAGSLLTALLAHLSQVHADSNRVFELMIYHTVPGQEPALESIFRDVSKLQAKHGNDGQQSVVGGDAAKKNWQALHADPAFPPYRKAAEPLIQRSGDQFQVDEVFMRPTDFSAMK